MVKDLLERAVSAHGGLQRWQQVNSLRTHIGVGGAIWHVKGWPDVYADIHCSIDPHKQHTEFSPFLKTEQRCVYEPNRTSIVTDGGEVIEQREAPRKSFEGHVLTTRWDAQNLIYFTGYAMWTYMTTPFLFQLPGFQTGEIDPWNEDGESWRRLKVTFPPDVPSHSTDQIFYFDTSGLLRRHDYSVEIMGGTKSANYATDHKTFAGIVFPTKRRVYTIGPDNQPLRDRVAVAIDIHSVDVA